MSKKEKDLDLFISKLLDIAKIKYSADGSSIKEINDALKTASKKGTGNVGFPEFVGISKDFIIVVEDKADLDKQANYADDEETKLAGDLKSLKDYAENGALHYGKHIVNNTNFKKIFAFGCSGNVKHHTIRPIFIDENGYTLLKPVENFENFSEMNIEKYYREQVLGETPPEILEKDELITKAKELHEYLRNYGQLGDDEKPLVVSAILLALSDPNFKTVDLTGDNVRTDGQKIFTAIEDYMKRVEVTPDTKKEKVLNQFIIIKDRTLLNQIDDRLKNTNQTSELAKTPLKFFTEFIEKNILASVKANTNEDLLGLFYGEFIRFSGGDGQTLGVVLTPSHITDLFCDLVDIQAKDRVFDPCCGTSAFLISALHKMLQLVKSEDDQHEIKKNQLHGIEIREDMFSIATTNMILRGDGKSNLENKDFLKVSIEDLRSKNYSIGFMNPPYSQAKGKDMAHLSEIHFIEHLLDGLADNGRCAVIIPQSTMVGKTSEDKKVKKRILTKHTLEGVITLNKETFYGVGTNPCIAIFTAHKPHSKKKFCKFINYDDDGYVVRKHVGLVETERAKERKAHLLNCWLHDAPAESKFMVKTTIEPEDEWLHSFYYFNDEIPKAEDFENTIADYLTFEFNMIMQGKSYLFENAE
ncbi:HsdM family class I SAM-dependent methyltransferase [Kaistella yonginensis]|uniref:HsdM family class I SAM-dependent methyltransferase n=1 Tax=Kaistella yonginensis TaxID=658267 RepID=UPI0025B41084|nr:N-6 DNA methylase [Kaistella yonginensis]MDN3605318.1 N-6 DNA methylase [Kaistella yonginensis]